MKKEVKKIKEFIIKNKNILFIELKALKDILKSKPFLSKNKKDTIKNH